MYRRAAEAVLRVIRMGLAWVRDLLRFDFARLLVGNGRDDGRQHFAETAVGGIAITFCTLAGIVLVLWLGSFL